MAKKSHQKPINEQELKAFGLLMTWAFPLFIGVIAPWIFNHTIQWWTLWVSAAFFSLALLSANLIYYPYRLWMFVAGIIGWINTRIILGVTFYCLIFPLGMVLRLFGKLQYKKQALPNEDNTSHYVKRDEKLDKKRLEQPF
ncbi:MAG: SxtJ family membrane protein [Thalassotalea sp.]|nr:SxtJ family membrane protein [Thalassotalea sp.]